MVSHQKQIDELWASVFDPERKTDVQRCREALYRLEDSTSGDRGHDRLLHACCVVHRFGIEGDDIRELVDWYNDRKCNPPWTDAELARKVREAYGKVAQDHTWGQDAKDRKQGYDLQVSHVDRYMQKEFHREWLVKDILVSGEPFVLGGPQKALKTSIAFDLAISLASGTPFLGQFEVPKVAPSLVLSGESGGATLQETIRRICRSKKRDSTGIPLFIGERLPQLSVQSHLASLKGVIQDNAIAFAAIDPAYLCTLVKGAADSSSNIFAMGAILAGLTQIGTDTGCTMCVIHHSKKPAARTPFHQPELTDMAGAGWMEWMRQWVIISHRERMRAGQFRLWMLVGGSAGHHNTYAIDVDEGRPDDPLTGREWGVTVRTEDQLESDRRIAEADARNAGGEECELEL